MKITFRFEYQIETDNIENLTLFHKEKEYLFDYGVFYSVKENDEQEEVKDEELLKELNNHLFISLKEDICDDIYEGFTVGDILDNGEIIIENTENGNSK